MVAAVSGCARKDDSAVWKTEVFSSDHQWSATAVTVQNRGSGSADITTSVYLQRVSDSRPPVAVLALSCRGPMPHPYVLDNVANAGGSIHLSMKWIDRSHLYVTYDAHPTLLLHVPKFRDVSVSYADLSGVTSGRRE